MAGSTNFPTSLDTDTELYDVTDDTTDVIAAHHNNAKEALKAIEAKVGIDSSAVTTSIDYHLSSALFMQTDHVSSDTVDSASYEDLAGLTMDITIVKTSDVILLLTVGETHRVNWGGKSYARINWDAGDSTREAVMDAGDNEERCMAASLFISGATAGTYTAKVEIKREAGSDDDTTTFTDNVLTAIVIPNSLS